MRFVDGGWQDQTPKRIQTPCTYPSSTGMMTDQNWNSQRWDWTSQLNGFWLGQMTTTVDSNECGFQGDYAITPLSALRQGDPLPIVPGAPTL
jgi:hypothetical protein